MTTARAGWQLVGYRGGPREGDIAWTFFNRGADMDNMDSHKGRYRYSHRYDSIMYYRYVGP